VSHIAVSESLEIARGHVVGIESEGYVATAVPLQQHQEFVKGFLTTVLRLGSEAPAVIASEVHDMYKPYTLRVEEREGELVIGFRGHPYKLSFTDLEGHIIKTRKPIVLDDSIKYKVAVATAIGRLHHFINIRDVESFFKTIALVKAYLDRQGVTASINELKSEILNGVVQLHMADTVAGFIEGVICTQYSKHDGNVGELLDTNSLLSVEPHVPISILLNIRDSLIDARLYIHGLKWLDIRSGSQFTARYTLYKVLIKEGRVEPLSKLQDFTVNIYVCHKGSLHRGLCLSKAGGVNP